jgi:hypothetical protein
VKEKQPRCYETLMENVVSGGGSNLICDEHAAVLQ